MFELNASSTEAVSFAAGILEQYGWQIIALLAAWMGLMLFPQIIKRFVVKVFGAIKGLFGR
jgi:hypothetical protein